MNESKTVQAQRHPASTRELKQDFARVDNDRDGRVDFAEFKQLLQGLDAEMSEQELRIGFREVDSDHDGLIDCREFIDWWSTD